MKLRLHLNLIRLYGEHGYNAAYCDCEYISTGRYIAIYYVIIIADQFEAWQS